MAGGRSWGVKDPAEERDCGKGDGGDEKRPQEKSAALKKKQQQKCRVQHENKAGQGVVEQAYQPDAPRMSP